jgi:hypothetical protein
LLLVLLNLTLLSLTLLSLTLLSLTLLSLTLLSLTLLTLTLLTLSLPCRRDGRLLRVDLNRGQRDSPDNEGHQRTATLHTGMIPRAPDAYKLLRPGRRPRATSARCLSPVPVAVL